MRNIISIKGGSCNSIMRHCESEICNYFLSSCNSKTIGFRLTKKVKS